MLGCVGRRCLGYMLTDVPRPSLQMGSTISWAWVPRWIQEKTSWEWVCIHSFLSALWCTVTCELKQILPPLGCSCQVFITGIDLKLKCQSNTVSRYLKVALFQFDFVNLFMACVSSRKYLLRRLAHLVIRSFVFLPLNSNNFVSIRHKHFSGCVVNKLFQTEIVFLFFRHCFSWGNSFDFDRV